MTHAAIDNFPPCPMPHTEVCDTCRASSLVYIDAPKSEARCFRLVGLMGQNPKGKICGGKLHYTRLLA